MEWVMNANCLNFNWPKLGHNQGYQNSNYTIPVTSPLLTLPLLYRPIMISGRWGSSNLAVSRRVLGRLPLKLNHRCFNDAISHVEVYGSLRVYCALILARIHTNIRKACTTEHLSWIGISELLSNVFRCYREDGWHIIINLYRFINSLKVQMF